MIALITTKCFTENIVMEIVGGVSCTFTGAFEWNKSHILYKIPVMCFCVLFFLSLCVQVLTVYMRV